MTKPFEIFTVVSGYMCQWIEDTQTKIVGVFSDKALAYAAMMQSIGTTVANPKIGLFRCTFNENDPVSELDEYRHPDLVGEWMDDKNRSVIQVFRGSLNKTHLD